MTLSYLSSFLLNLNCLVLFKLLFCLLINHDNRIKALHIRLLNCLALIVVGIDILSILRRLFKFLRRRRVLFLRARGFHTLLLFHRRGLECQCFHFLLLQQLLALLFFDASALLLL